MACKLRVIFFWTLYSFIWIDGYPRCCGVPKWLYSGISSCLIASNMLYAARCVKYSDLTLGSYVVDHFVRQFWRKIWIMFGGLFGCHHVRRAMGKTEAHWSPQSPSHALPGSFIVFHAPSPRGRPDVGPAELEEPILEAVTEKRREKSNQIYWLAGGRWCPASSC